VSSRLLLDEMFSPRIATELAARGHDCLAVVADPVARMSSDADLLRRALDNGRALVTNNVVDFERLRRQRRSASTVSASARSTQPSMSSGKAAQ
jgi:predicted nuclease of predicted toxin-antitoxin system